MIKRYRLHKELRDYPRLGKQDRIDALFFKKRLDVKGLFWTIVFSLLFGLIQTGLWI